MLIIISIILWIVDNIFNILHYKKQEYEKDKYFRLIGMFAAMIASVLIVYTIGISSGDVNYANTHKVTANGVEVSPASYLTMQNFAIWLILGAIINLSAMGLSYLIYGIISKKK